MVAVPKEDRILVIAEEQLAIVIPAEWRKIRVLETMLVASKQHTEGDSKRWTVQYGRWLDNPAKIETVDIQSDSTSLVVEPGEILGTDVNFLVHGGTLGEQAIVRLAMTDNQGNIKHDTIRFTVIAA